jgi:plastocyanin
MQSIKTILVFSSLLLLTSCSKDDYGPREVAQGSSISYNPPSSSYGNTSSTTSPASSSTETSLTYSISVSAQSSSNYILSGTDLNGAVNGNDPNITINKGDTINFNVAASGHPFFLIKNSNGGFGSDNLIEGVSNNGAENGTISWTSLESGTYYYICEYHPSMIGIITVNE